MIKERKRKIILGLSVGQIYLLVTMIFAFSFMLGQELKTVSAAGGLKAGTPATANIDPSTTAGNDVPAGPSSSVSLMGTAGGGTSPEAIAGSWPEVSETFTGTISHNGMTAVYEDGERTRLTPGIDEGVKSTSKSFSEILKAPFKGEIFRDPTTGKFATTNVGGLGNSLIQGLSWGLVVGGVLYMLGGMLGASKANQGTLFKAGLFGGVAGGIAKWVANQGVLGTTQPLGMSANSFGTLFGLGITVAIIIFMWKETKQQLVTLTCMPWEPQLGGAKCAECNKDPFRPCSEYRCKSLGQGCDIVNKGTDKEQCVWVSKFDVNSPKISVWNEPLTSGLRYAPMATRPMDRGAKIVNTIGGKECLQAYTPLQFGIVTDEPAQCKVDYTQKNFSEMQFYLGGTNYYQMNHTQRMRLPSATTPDGVAAPLFQNDGTMQLWIQCQDANGNKNVDMFLMEFCVDKSPDTTAPIIEAFSIVSGSPVQYGIDHVPIEAYTNEPAQCKWSRADKNYDSMENGMQCSSSASEINGNLQYTCSGNLTAVKDRESNDFYFRCRDLAGNTNTEGKKFSLIGSQPLNILSIKPNETIFGSTNTVPVHVEIETGDGSDSGKAKCYYSGALTTGFNQMLETDSYLHKQTLDLTTGNYSYTFRCVDAGGNVAEQNATFSVFVDNQAPMVTRVYRDTSLKVVTNEDAECYYSKQSCDFELNKGIKMEYGNVNVLNQLFAPWAQGVTYYIKCEDKYGNQPSPNECSVIASPKLLSSDSSSANTLGTIGTTSSTGSGGNTTIGTTG